MAETKDKKPDKKKEFGSPKEVINVVKSLQDVEDDRASDRAKINDLFNGKRPYTSDEEEKYNIQVNVNWGEGKRIMRDANSQLNNALLHPGTLFQCSLREGPVDKRDAWSATFTKNIHIPLQEGISGRKNFFLVKDRNASVCMHGVGAMMWANPYIWRPRFVGMEDLLIPTETKCDFSNLRYFAVNLYLTIGELIEMAKGDKAKKGWNQDMVDQILDGHKDLYNESTPSTWRDQPEAMKQIFFENSGYYYSDAIPKVRLVQFFYQEMDTPNKWYRVVYPRENIGGKIKDIEKKFLFDGTDEPFADDISQIINVQYGDSNYVAPLKYHTVRGLGIDLYSPVETLNRLRCEFVQAVFEHMKMYFRIKDPADRDRAKQQILSQYGFIQDGMEIIPRDQRQQIDANLIGDAMGQMSQIMQSSSSSYVASQDTGGEKQMTAKEAMIKVNQANVLVSAMLQTMYLQEGFYYDELKRRFCQESPTDPDIKAFQARCIKEGVPKEYMTDPDAWKVTPERVLGGGDKSLAQQQALWLLQVKNMFDPKAQQTILRPATQSMLDDPAKAALLVPATPVTATDGTYMAENVFGTLMTGNQVSIRQGIDQQGYVMALLKMLGTVVQRISGSDNMGTPNDLIGLVTVVQNINQHVMILAADDQQKQLVKQLGDALGKIVNLIKAFAQRQNQAKQAAQNKQQGDPQAAAKAQSTIMGAKIKAAITQQKAQAKANQDMLQFKLDEARKDMELMADIKREDIAHKQDMMNETFERALEAIRSASQVETGGE